LRLDLLSLGGSSRSEVVRSLQIQPELRGGIEISGETQCGVGSLLTLIFKGLRASRILSPGWGKGILWFFLRSIVVSPVTGTVIGNFDFESMSFLPSKTDPVPIVDADAVLARSISLQRRLKPICRRRRQVSQLIRTVDLNQFTECDLSDPLKSPDSPLPEDRLGDFIAEGTDQTAVVLRLLSTHDSR
jgi:hypothetical protein